MPACTGTHSLCRVCYAKRTRFLGNSNQKHAQGKRCRALTMVIWIIITFPISFLVWIVLPETRLARREIRGLLRQSILAGRPATRATRGIIVPNVALISPFVNSREWPAWNRFELEHACASRAVGISKPRRVHADSSLTAKVSGILNAMIVAGRST